MPAKDIFHDAVKRAIEKDGWIITDDPIYLDYGGLEIYIDLGAERLIAAQKAGEKIAVEVKSFVGGSTISQFHTALGQFINYRTALSQKQPERELYLGVPSITYETFFKLELIQIVIQSQNLKLLIYNPEQEVIEQWIK
ncbi:MAG: XisH family protein [Gloeotrichia echinulata DVL01]|jgi:hypothetical protein|nr:XisH family protein [Gloeotrichia echinulata DEX184]